MKRIFIFWSVALLCSCGSSNSTGNANNNPGNDQEATTATGEVAASTGSENTASETPAANEKINPSADEFSITGKIANAPNQQVMLDRYSLAQNQQSIGSAMTSGDGSFAFSGKISEKGLYLIRMNNNANWLIVLDKGKYDFKADANDIYHYTIEGAPESKAFSAFIVKAGENQSALSQLSQQYNMARATGNAQQMQNVQQQYQSKYSEHQNYIRSVIDGSEYPLLTVFAASLLNAEENADYLEKFIAKAKQKLPGSSYVVELKEKVESVTRLAIGRVAPDIALKSPKGENIKLSSTRGKVVLLDFWASWCRPCRNENPNVVRMYDKYQGKGFEVFSVSLDQNMDKWVNAIKADNLKWKNHGSTLQGWQCPVAQTYEVHSIPNALLLDREGKIIGKNLRGAELENKLRELFGS